MGREPRLNILLSGMLAGEPYQGGASWAVLQYLLGLGRLGHEVMFVEPIASASLGPAGTSLGASRIGVYFQHHLAPLAGAERAALLVEGTTETLGAPYEELERFARGADLLVNISGMLADERLLEHVPVRAFLDLDPGFNQVWYEDGERHGLRRAHPLRHRRAGHRLRRLPGAHLRAWPGSAPAAGCAGALARGRPAVSAMRSPRVGPLAKLRLDRARRGPLRAAGPLAAGADRAARPHPGRGSSWPSRSTPTRPATWRPWRRTAGSCSTLTEAAGTPTRYRDFVRGSKAELGVAKSGYVASRCGWFSDRSACYLASGRPVVAQETGFSAFLPRGEGLLAFSSVEEAASAIDEVEARLGAAQPRGTRAGAEEHLDSDRVLTRLLEKVTA